MSKTVACIGTREPSEAMKPILQAIGAWLVKEGWTINTGNALGSDQLFAMGGNSVNPTQVHLFLPWASYESNAVVVGNKISLVTAATDQMVATARAHHPVFDKLSQGAQKLMIRNVQIIDGVRFVMALPSAKIGGGGTGQGMRVAATMGIKVFDLNDPVVLKNVMSKIGL